MACRRRVLVAVSELRSILAHTCAREGVALVTVPAEYTTVDCSRCGSRERFDAAAELRHRCGACGSEWDQDANAARNLLSQTLADPGQNGGLRNDSPRTPAATPRVTA